MSSFRFKSSILHLMAFLQQYPFLIFGLDWHSFALTWLNNFRCRLWFLTSHLISRTCLCQYFHILTLKFIRMPIFTRMIICIITTSSTLKAVLAEVSMKMRLFSLANLSPSSVETYLLASKSHLLPISIITISGLPFCLTSSNHLVKWLNVSLLHK